jgi:hypothetical protein
MEHDKRPYIEIYFENHEKLITLLDTGAETNVISYSIVGFLKLDNYFTPFKTELRGIGGKKSIIGNLDVPVSFDTGTTGTIVSFRVMDDNEYEAILGIKFMEDYGIVINVNERFIIVEKQESLVIPFVKLDQYKKFENEYLLKQVYRDFPTGLLDLHEAVLGTA